MAAELSVATFNLHGGVDAWGRPYDVVRAASALDADLLLLQEVWSPEGGTSQAVEIARATGGTAFEVVFGEGRLAGPRPEAPLRWQRRGSRLDGDHALFFDASPPTASVRRSARYLDAERGSFGVALVSRLTILDTERIELVPLRRDHVGRALLVAHVELDGAPLAVLCAHLSHLTHGSPRHFRELRAELERLGGADSPTVAGGDMNLWGPAVALQLPGWHRAVRARTWPSWSPHSQLDHLLVGRSLEVLGGRAVDERGSDHRPLVARLRRR